MCPTMGHGTLGAVFEKLVCDNDQRRREEKTESNKLLSHENLDLLYALLSTIRTNNISCVNKNFLDSPRHGQTGTGPGP